MWNVNGRFSQTAIENLAALGFRVGSTRGVVRVGLSGWLRSLVAHVKFDVAVVKVDSLQLRYIL